MKDESKAKWPDGMIGLRTTEGDRHVYKIMGKESIDATLYAPDDDMLEHRTMQVRHLPRMVALLKELKQLDDDDKINIGSVKVNIESILRDIGEIE